jgi:hypothetical protein
VIYETNPISFIECLRLLISINKSGRDVGPPTAQKRSDGPAGRPASSGITRGWLALTMERITRGGVHLEGGSPQPARKKRDPSPARRSSSLDKCAARLRRGRVGLKVPGAPSLIQREREKRREARFDRAPRSLAVGRDVHGGGVLLLHPALRTLCAHFLSYFLGSRWLSHAALRRTTQCAQLSRPPEPSQGEIELGHFLRRRRFGERGLIP